MHGRPILSKPDRAITAPRPRRLPFDLSIARTNRVQTTGGDFMIYSSGPANISVTIRLDSERGDPIVLFPGDKFSAAAWDRFYITNAAGSGTAVLLIGGDESFDFVPQQTSSLNLAPATTAFDAEVLALTASWTELFDFTNARGHQGVIFIFNDGPNAIRVTTNSGTAADRGIQIAAGGYRVIDNPGGQRWYVRTVTANQVTNAATILEGFWTGA